MVWSSPERHAALTGLMKTQIDWVPLSGGAVRPTHLKGDRLPARYPASAGPRQDGQRGPKLRRQHRECVLLVRGD